KASRGVSLRILNPPLGSSAMDCHISCTFDSVCRNIHDLCVSDGRTELNKFSICVSLYGRTDKAVVNSLTSCLMDFRLCGEHLRHSLFHKFRRILSVLNIVLSHDLF